MIFWLLFLAVLACVLWMIAVLEWRKRTTLKDIPGPPTVPLFGNVFQVGQTPKDLLNALLGFSEIYQRMYRVMFGPFKYIVVLNEPEDFEVVMTSTKAITKGDLYLVLRPWLGQGLLTSTGEHWHRHRKLITPAFHFKILESFTEIFASNCEILVENLRKYVGDASVDIYKPVTLCALDVMLESTMGVSLCVQKFEDCEYLETLREASRIMMMRGTKPWLYKQEIFDLTSDGKSQKKHVQILHNFTTELIERRKKAKLNTIKKEENDDEFIKKKLAFLDLLLDIQEKNESFTDIDIREESDTFVFEGHDTTTSGISFCLYNIAKYPEIQEKIVEELNSIFGGSSRRATFADLQSMNYLDRVIKESLRMYPSVPIIFRLAEDDIYLKDNIKIAKGCEIGMLIKRIGMNPKVWESPEKFDPDRFLPENIRTKHAFSFVAFSAGQRNCIGQKFAMLEMKSTISSVLRNFRVKDVNHKLDLAVDLILKSNTGIHVGLEERN